MGRVADLDRGAYVALASLGADGDAAGDEPGDQHAGRGGHPRPGDHGAGGQADDDGVGEDDEGEHVATALRGAASGGALGLRGRTGGHGDGRGDRPGDVGGHGRGHDGLDRRVGLGLHRGPEGGADRRDDEPGAATVDGLATREHPHRVRELLDRPAADHLVVVLEGLGDQVDGPRHGKGDEDESAQVHVGSVGARSTSEADVKWCVAELLV